MLYEAQCNVFQLTPFFPFRSSARTKQGLSPWGLEAQPASNPVRGNTFLAHCHVPSYGWKDLKEAQERRSETNVSAGDDQMYPFNLQKSGISMNNLSLRLAGDLKQTKAMTDNNDRSRG